MESKKQETLDTTYGSQILINSSIGIIEEKKSQRIQTMNYGMLLSKNTDSMAGRGL
jgi:hypothetical protein